MPEQKTAINTAAEFQPADSLPPPPLETAALAVLEMKFREQLNKLVDLKLWDGETYDTPTGVNVGVHQLGERERSLSFRVKVLDTRQFEDTLLVRVLSGSGSGPWGSADFWLDSKIVHSMNGASIKPE